jgi:hypothetical protein
MGRTPTASPIRAWNLRPIAIEYSVSPGGIGKAEGFADDVWTKPSASWRLPLPPKILTCYEEPVHNRHDLPRGVRHYQVLL